MTNEPRVGTPEREAWQKVLNRRAAAMLETMAKIKPEAATAPPGG